MGGCVSGGGGNPLLAFPLLFMLLVGFNSIRILLKDTSTIVSS